MKIGILTLPLHTNYGGILQAYALQTVLERMGHDVEVFNRKQIRNLPARWPMALFKRMVKKFILRQKIIVLAERYHNKYYPELSRNTQLFIDSYIKQRFLQSLDDVKEFDYDAIIVGSDQVWNPSCFRPMWNSTMENAFLNFAEKWNIKKVAYAASFGNDVWTFSQLETVACKKMISRFSGVSVREIIGLEMCRTNLGITAELVPDPTLLLSENDYMNLVKKSNVKKSAGSLLYYILDDSSEKNALVQKIAADRNLVPFRVNSKIEDVFASIEDRIQPSVEQWLQGFYDAEFVVTDSFHACVFSIIFGKPFVVYGNASRGLTRFSSLLSCFGIEDNLIISLSEYSKEKGGLVASEKSVEEFRDKGFAFLKKGLYCNA